MTRATDEAFLGTTPPPRHATSWSCTLATLHPDVRFDDQPLGQHLDGPEGARRHCEPSSSAFGADPEPGSTRWITDDLAAGETAFVGRHVGSSAGPTPTRRRVRAPSIVFVDFRDGRLSGERFAHDLNGVVLRLGPAGVPPPAAVRRPGTAREHSTR